MEVTGLTVMERDLCILGTCCLWVILSPSSGFCDTSCSLWRAPLVPGTQCKLFVISTFV